jgi:hypothetical protein
MAGPSKSRPPMSHRKTDLMVWNDPALGGIVCQSSVVRLTES